MHVMFVHPGFPNQFGDVAAYLGTLLFLRNLYRCPFVGYFELLPPPPWSAAFDARPEFPASEEKRVYSTIHHAITYLQLHAVDAAYSPTHFQRSTAPPELQAK